MHKTLFIFLLICTNLGLLLGQAPNGFYVGEVCKLAEANIVYYNTPLRIQVDKPLEFKGGFIHSSNNQNDLHRIALEVEKVPENTWLILKIDESYYSTCLRSKKRKRQYARGESSKPIFDDKDKVTTDTTNSKGGFVIEKQVDADRISKFLKIEIIDRKHFGHKLVGEMKTQKKVHTLGKPIVLDFTMKNVGQGPVKLKWNNWVPGSTTTFDRLRFRVVHNGKKLKAKKKQNLNSNDLKSEPTPSYKLLAPDGQLQHSIDLSEWFDFDQPGKYLVSWNYRMELMDGQKEFDASRAPEFYWDDEVGGKFVLVVK